MTFYINHIDDTSIAPSQKVLPVLTMILVHDGRHDFHKFHEMIQDAEITFSMYDIETGMYKVVNSPAYIEKLDGNCCEEEYCICYQFTKREVQVPGNYRGFFTIKFLDDLKNDNYCYTPGVLKVPIRDELNIIVR